MASLPFTLAALATSAVPGLSAVAVRAHSSPGDEYASAILTTETDEVLISVPRNTQAETTQSASILGLTALSDGARSELPFEVPRVLGLTRAGETRAVAMTYLQGSNFDLADLEADAILIDSIAETIAAIHALPRSLAQQGGLADRSARDLRLLATRIVDRAVATRSLPETVHRRWSEVLEAAELWDFEPLPVHGTLSDETLLVDDDRVTGVLDWSGFSVGDPATDLAWLLGADDGVFDAVLGRYLELGNSGAALAIRARSALYHELEIARWLLHGVESHDQSIIDDAVSMLDRLVDRLSLLESPVPERQHLNEAGAVELLGRTPQVVDRLSDTAAYEALDEDRMFGVDTDFIEPPAKVDAGVSSSDAANADGASAETAGTITGDDIDTSGEQLTLPIADEDLPR